MTKIKKTEILFILGLLVLVAPFFFLSFYCHPSADDFKFSAIAIQMSSFDYVAYMFNNWSGRYFGNFLFSFNPLIFKWIYGYKFIPIILLLLLYFSMFQLLRNLLQTGFSKLHIHIFSLVLILLFLNTMPSVSDYLYWLSSSLQYLTGSILTLLFLSILLKENFNNTSSNTLYYFIKGIILCILIVGANEINTLFLLAVILLISLSRKNCSARIKLFNWIFLIILLIMLPITLLSPGNLIRSTTYPMNFDFIHTMVRIIIDLAKTIFLHFQSPLFIIVSLLFFINSKKFINSSKVVNHITNINPFLSFSISILIIAGLYFPSNYAMRHSPLRIFDSVFFVFLLLWFYNLIALYNYCTKHNFIKQISIPKYLTNIFIIIAFLFTFIDFHKKVPNEPVIFRSNISMAYYDLFFKAFDFNKAMNERYIKIHEAQIEDNKTVVVKELKQEPKTILHIDITKSPEHPINKWCASYFELDSIYITKQ